MPRRRLGLFTMVIGLTGCAAMQPPDAMIPETAKSVSASPRPLFPIAPPQGPARRIVQQLTAHWPGREQTLLCVLELDGRHIAMAGLTEDGLSLFNLSYDGKILQADKNPLVPEMVAPELIIADLQLVYWPLDVLQYQLPKQLKLEAGPDFRRLSAQGQASVEVRYLSHEDAWPRKVELINLRYHYRLTIDTVSYEAVSE
ncbi:DUF3261 domain-containing protein [Methylomicrobium sp. Wu6]|uniref:DUF3261 domain-containing protein n=1 Tax=Methylomicrobium sp. Wu6 TaxID=3107928 RepID=UPI002DD63EF0|nr:DUF3261 domain-containing protein [Methylomicrobium sp. Wu6]MEC4749384.1 DUF3261 domain-containing protein [Methylomicrobium sp. Wu6]